MHIVRTLAAAALAASLPVAAQAAQLAALWGDNTISIIDTDARKVTKTWTIAGVAGRVAGIDVRPADGMLYAVFADGTVATVDLGSGKATVKSKLEMMLPAAAMATIDFNPAADRLRLIASDGTNLRANVDDGKVTKDGALKYKDGDANAGKMPKVIAGAYSNSFKGTKETALYDIDAGNGAFVRQAPPNDGVLNTLGKFSVTGGSWAFDIWSDGRGGNEGWLLAGGVLHKVDIATGKTAPAGKVDGVKGQVRDIAILPAM
jgi:DNA-binding beta-propeller fold protein YncE